jgi:hypothetical protein
MPKDFAEVELLKPGSDQSTAVRGTYIGNMSIEGQSLVVRPGFGQIAQLDTTLGLPGISRNNFGYTQNLASIAIKTTFGNTQIVTLVQNRAFTGNIASTGQWSNLYSLVVFDVTSRGRWEVVLHRHTGEFNNAVIPMPNQWATYGTNRSDDFQAWETSEENPPDAYMVEFQDTVLFGSKSLGLWCYTPSDFSTRRRQQVDGIALRDHAPEYGESSLVFRIVPQPGQFEASRFYMDTAGFPSPTDITVFRKRVAMIRGRDIFFSDEGVPNAIAGINTSYIPSDNELTAIQEVNGSLLIFTATETWLMRPPATSTPAQGGELVRISNTIGCDGPMAKCRYADKTAWVDAFGIHASNGGYEIASLADGINDLFNDRLSNPLSSYYQAIGATTLANQQPKTFYNWTDTARKGISLTYDSDWDRLFVSVPTQNLILCGQDGSWAFWSVESMCQTTTAVIGTLSNIQNPRLLSLEGEVYLVGGSDILEPDDKTAAPQPQGAPIPLLENAHEWSLYILQLGHGGGLDRTGAPQALEDNRVFAGYYNGEITAQSLNQYYQIREPIRLPVGYVLPRGSVVGSDTADWTYLFPVYMVPVDGIVTDKFQLIFAFDHDEWTPVTIGATEEIDYTLPSERYASRFGYSYGAPVDGVAEIQVYDMATGVPAVGGDVVAINWDGAVGTALNPWTFGDMMALNYRHPNPICYLPFKKKTGTMLHNSMSLGITLLSANIQCVKLQESHTANLFWWHAPFIPTGYMTVDDRKAQPVDWCFKSEQVGIKGQGQIKAKTLYAQILSHGKGSAGLYPTWIHGLYNATCSADWKDWCSQIIDYAGDDNMQPNITDDEDKGTLRMRMKDSATTYAELTFNPTGTTGPKWSTVAAPTTGNLLIGDEQLNTIAIGDSTKGEYVSWMVYGHIRDHAEVFTLASLKASLIAIEGRRRRGR